MNDFSLPGGPSDLLADDLLLDRIGGRREAGGDPVAGLLVALAAHADNPLPARTGRRRIANKHRYLGAFAALAVAASGAGVAAAVTLPDEGSAQANRARIEQRMEQSARSGAPSVLLSRLGLPATDGTTAARGLVLARGANGTFVLLPAAAAAAQAKAFAAGRGTGADSGAGPGAAPGTGAAADPGADPGAVPGGDATVADPAPGKAKPSKTEPAKPAKPGKARPATGPAAGNGQNGNGQGADGQGWAGATGQTGSDQIWVIEPATDLSTAGPSGTVVAAPPTSSARVADPSAQHSLVGPGTSPQKTNRHAVVPGVGPSVSPGAAHSQRPSAPQATNPPGAAKSAVAAA